MQMGTTHILDTLHTLRFLTPYTHSLPLHTPYMQILCVKYAYHMQIVNETTEVGKEVGVGGEQAGAGVSSTMLRKVKKCEPSQVLLKVIYTCIHGCFAHVHRALLRIYIRLFAGK